MENYPPGHRGWMATEPSAWQLHAGMLFTCAAQLQDSFPEVRHMLEGMSAEDTLKGLMIAQGKPALNPDGSLHEKFRGHDLAKLARNAELLDKTSPVLSAEDEELLDCLAYYITTAGRYPINSSPKVPMRWERFPWRPEETDRRIADLLDRLNLELLKALQAFNQSRVPAATKA